MACGSLRENLQRGIVQDARAPGIAMNNAAVAVLHVFAQADIGDDQQRWELLLQQPDGLLDDAIARRGSAGFQIFLVGDAEQQHRRHARFMSIRGVAQ